MLGRRELAHLDVPLPLDPDRLGARREVEVVPAERVELAWAGALVDRDVEVGGERWRGQLVSQRDHARRLGLRGRLDVASATRLRQPKARERVAVHEPAGVGAARHR